MLRAVSPLIEASLDTDLLSFPLLECEYGQTCARVIGRKHLHCIQYTLHVVATIEYAYSDSMKSNLIMSQRAPSIPMIECAYMCSRIVGSISLHCAYTLLVWLLGL